MEYQAVGHQWGINGASMGCPCNPRSVPTNHRRDSRTQRAVPEGRGSTSLPRPLHSSPRLFPYPLL